MLNKIKMMAVVLGIVAIASCTKNYNYEIEVENVTVTLDAQKLIANVQHSPLAKAMSAGNVQVDVSYKHGLPTTFRAYFVSKETKGQYTKGQVVKIIDNIVEGGNNVTIPALNYSVIVTNYQLNTDNLLGNGREQLPEQSKVLYLYGQNDIDYSTEVSGNVEVTNDYAALLVYKNEVTLPETIYDNTPFLNTPDWYVLYARKKNGKGPIGKNIQIPVTGIDGTANKYNSSQSFPNMQPNEEYRIIFTRNAGNGNGANLNVDVQEDILKEVNNSTPTIN